MVFLLAGLSVLAARADCPAIDGDPLPGLYSREDVAEGRLPRTAALHQLLLQIGGERIRAAIVTDAARDVLDDSWPAFLPQSRLMLVDLDSGRLIWELVQAPYTTALEAHTSDPRLIASLGAAAVLLGRDGLAQRLYVGDSSGRVWRIDLPPLSTVQASATDWQLTLLADLTPVGLSGSVEFRVAPDLVRSIDSNGRPFDGVLITSEGAITGASGDAGNGLFFLRDYAVQMRRRGEVPPDVITWPDLALPGNAGTRTQAGVGAGWFARFRHDVEVARHRPLTDGGRVFLVTALPATACDEPPLALTYVFNLTDGRPAEETLRGTVASVGRPGGPTIENRAIVLPGLGVALPVGADGGNGRYRRRFNAEGIFARVAYWRDLLLDAE